VIEHIAARRLEQNRRRALCPPSQARTGRSLSNSDARAPSTPARSASAAVGRWSPSIAITVPGRAGRTAARA